jgi:malate dehydrogenase
MAVWGNHSPTMYPDLFNAKVKGEVAADLIDDQVWIEEQFLPTVGKRGAAIIDARGASSAASAASAAIDHVRDWALGADGWRSMAIHSTGDYDIEEGIICSFPVTCSGGSYEVVQGVELTDFSKEKIQASVDELKEEREAVKDLI